MGVSENGVEKYKGYFLVAIIAIIVTPY